MSNGIELNPMSQSVADENSNLFGRYTPIDAHNAKTLEDRKRLFNQVKIPAEKHQYHKAIPWVVISHNKVVRYDIKRMSIWRSLLMYQYTILKLPSTYYLLIYLTAVCFAVTALTFCTGGAKSVDITISVFTRVNMLLSFVLATYVSICVSRWDNLRQNHLGKLWGALENINVIVTKILANPNENKAEKKRIYDRVLRYSKLIMRMMFLIGQETDDMSVLITDGLLTETEESWLKAATLGTRHLVVLGWISNIVETLLHNRPELRPELYGFFQGFYFDAKGGAGAVLAVLGCPLPFMYVHAIYWVCQVSLVVLAIETGMQLAVYAQRRHTGNGDYTSPGDDYVWPLNSNDWFAGIFLQITCQNVFFAVFLIGLLKVSEKLANPLSSEFLSFPEYLYEAALHNNITALQSGEVIYSCLPPEERVGDSSINSNTNIHKDSINKKSLIFDEKSFTYESEFSEENKEFQQLMSQSTIPAHTDSSSYNNSNYTSPHRNERASMMEFMGITNG